MSLGKCELCNMLDATKRVKGLGGKIFTICDRCDNLHYDLIYSIEDLEKGKVEVIEEVSK